MSCGGPADGFLDENEGLLRRNSPRCRAARAVAPGGGVAPRLSVTILVRDGGNAGRLSRRGGCPVSAPGTPSDDALRCAAEVPQQHVVEAALVRIAAHVPAREGDGGRPEDASELALLGRGHQLILLLDVDGDGAAAERAELLFGEEMGGENGALRGGDFHVGEAEPLAVLWTMDLIILLASALMIKF